MDNNLIEAIRRLSKTDVLHVDPSLLRYMTHLIDEQIPYLSKMSYLRKIFDETGPRDVLDFGCGKGAWKKRIEDIGHSWRGIDLHESTDFADPNRAGIHIDTYDGRRLPYSDGEFDIVYSCQSFEHVEDPHLSMSECSRVLKSGGFFVGSVSFLEPYHAYQTFCYSPYGFCRLAEQHGLMPQSISPESDALFWITRKLSRISEVSFDVKCGPIDFLADVLGAKFSKLPVKAQVSLGLQFCGTFNFLMIKHNARR
jgi:SAM-dependent methyltransferase